MANIIKNTTDATELIVKRWPKGHSIFIEDCDFEPEGVKVLFCKYADRNNVEAEWIHALIEKEHLETHTLQVLKDSCTDKSDPVSGEHVQSSSHINEAVVNINLFEYLQTYVKLYIEDAQPFKVLPEVSLN